MKPLTKRLSRRTLLRGAGGVALALPFLEAMQAVRPRRLAAAPTPKRFVTWFTSNGSIMDVWQPTGTETSFTLTGSLQALTPHKDQLVIMRGLNNEASYIFGPNPHDAACATMLTGAALKAGPSGTGRAGHILDGTCDGPSIDQEIARVIGGQTKFASLELGVQSTTTILEPMVTRICYRGTLGAAKSLPLEDDPKKVFARLFMDANASAASLEALKVKRKSVLDAALRDFERVNAKVGAADRTKLDRHATTVRQVETALDKLGGTGLTCTIPSTPPAANLDPVDCLQDGRPARCSGDFLALGQAQMDLLVLSLACDLTRVATLQWSTAESTTFHKWLNVRTEHHLMTHDVGTYRSDLIKVETWYAQQFAKFLDALKSHTDADGTTLLDSAIVLWPNELSEGQSHSRKDLGWLLAGKGNGALRTGRNLRFMGNATNQLFASLMTMYGAPTAGFGDPKFKGTLPGLA
jgi:hypothetical protein